jgi:dynein heavy chain 1, cytosolic
MELRANQTTGNELLGKLRKMRMLADDDDEVTPVAGPSKGQTSQQPAWMRTLLERCREWLSQLPAVRYVYF